LNVIFDVNFIDQCFFFDIDFFSLTVIDLID